MRLKRTALALICTSTLFFAACSSSGTQISSGDSNSESSEDGTEIDGLDGLDDLGDLGDMGDMPEPEIDNIPDVVAEVNGAEITRDEFLPDFEAQFQQIAMMGQTEGLDQDEIKSQVANMIVDRELIIQEAEAAGIEPTDDDVEDSLQAIATQNGLSSIEELFEIAEGQGVPEDKMREDAGKQFQIDAYMDEQADIEIPSDEELKKQYDEMLEELGEEELEGADIPEFEEMRDQMQDQARSDQLNAVADSIIEELRDAADITMHI